MTDIAYERRFARYTELVREIIARLGTKDGIRWIAARKALVHRSLVAFEEEWREECRLLDAEQPIVPEDDYERSGLLNS